MKTLNTILAYSFLAAAAGYLIAVVIVMFRVA